MWGGPLKRVYIFRDEVKKTLEATRDKRSRVRGIPLQCDTPLLLYIRLLSRPIDRVGLGKSQLIGRGEEVFNK